MSRMLFVLSFSLFFSFQTMAQARSSKIKFSTEIHNFGTIKEADGKVAYKFEYTNSGVLPLIITNVDASCGCTTPEWTKTPVMPGKKGFVSTEFDPAHYQKFDKSIIVHTNGEPSSVTLRIVGDVIPKEKTMQDIFAYNFGKARVKGKNIAFSSLTTSEKEVRFEIFNDSRQEMNISLENLPKYIKVDNSNRKIKAGEIAVFKFIATPQNTTKGFHKDLISIKVDGVLYSNALKIVASVK